jgi:hypothetical protein
VHLVDTAGVWKLLGVGVVRTCLLVWVHHEGPSGSGIENLGKWDRSALIDSVALSAAKKVSQFKLLPSGGSMSSSFTVRFVFAVTGVLWRFVARHGCNNPRDETRPRDCAESGG